MKLPNNSPNVLLNPYADGSCVLNGKVHKTFLEMFVLEVIKFRFYM
jgi:hypothetical protein